MAEVSLALEYLRSKRIIHRDLKPANMLLDSGGHVHLTDFNVATFVRTNVPVTSTTGTRPYMGKDNIYMHVLIKILLYFHYEMCYGSVIVV